MAQQSLVGQGVLIIENSRSHSHTPYSVGLLWTSDQPDGGTSTRQHTTQDTHIHDLGGIRSRKPSKQAHADPLLRPCGHCNRSVYLCIVALTDTDLFIAKTKARLAAWNSKATS